MAGAEALAGVVLNEPDTAYSAFHSEAAGTGVPATQLRLLEGELDRRWSAGTDALDAICHYALTPSGKLFRPILLLQSALAVGGSVGQVLPAAVGTECGHVASLIHDDIIDADELRRGRPSVQHKYGTDDAIVAGDALIFYLFYCLAECRRAGAAPHRVVTALEIVARSGLELCRGQSLEAEITANQVRDVDAYLRMIRLKTAALFRGACQSGAVLGGGCDEWVAALGSYGDHLGLAFQIHDDLFAFDGDGETIGKSTTSDIRNRRLTLPILLAYQAGDAADCDLLDGALAGDADPAEALHAVAGVMARTGAVEASRELALCHALAAQQDLAVLPPTPSRDTLADFAERAVTRAC